MIIRAGRPGILRGIARTAVVAGTAQAVAGRVNHRQQQRWAAETPTSPVPAQPAPAASPPVGAPADIDGMFDALRQLGELRDQGILTELEFQTKKAQILAG